MISALPDWLVGDLLSRYREAANELQASCRSDRSLFETMLSVAIGQAEQAREAVEKDRTESERLEPIADRWETANNAAVRLAEHLEGLDPWLTLQRFSAAGRASGVTFKSGNGRTPNKALAAFLRALAKQRLVKGAPHQHLSRRIGPFSISSGRRPRMVNPVTLLTIDLAYLFREIAAGMTTDIVQVAEKGQKGTTIHIKAERRKRREGEACAVVSGAVVDGGEYWRAASAFARAAFNSKADLDSIERAAHDWANGKTLRRVGWR
jgi:hypothetical protein